MNNIRVKSREAYPAYFKISLLFSDMLTKWKYKIFALPFRLNEDSASCIIALTSKTAFRWKIYCRSFLNNIFVLHNDFPPDIFNWNLKKKVKQRIWNCYCRNFLGSTVFSCKLNMYWFFPYFFFNEVRKYRDHLIS